ncbi:MAG: VWA domain-containing protein [Clostridia bacterium]|nr:VWA domain-containing protein [Clostridia bacterium]
MKKNLTELVLILDQSGSMHGLEKDTIGGFNSMIDKQRDEAGEALVSTVLFSGDSVVLHDRIPLEKVPEMTARDYRPGGCTALIDAIGGAIHHIGNVHKYARAEDVPEHTVFVIITDGMENASRRYTADRVREMIRRQKEKYGWEFLFLAANIDAVQTAARYGIDEDRAVEFRNDSDGQALNYRVVSEAVACVRASAPMSADWKDAIEQDFRRRGGRK